MVYTEWIPFNYMYIYSQASLYDTYEASIIITKFPLIIISFSRLIITWSQNSTFYQQ